MTIGTAVRILFLFVSFSVFLASASAQAAPANADLQYVVMLSRHGVRPPLSKPGEIDSFSAAAWPQWEVPPGYLTPHGFELMKIFGAWDRDHFTREGLFSADSCANAARVTILADSDERTRETGKALALGMFPGCNVDVHAKPEGSPDPLFRESQAGNPTVAAAIAGRLGGNADNLTAALHPQLEQLDSVLAGCGKDPATNPKRTSIFDVPTGISPTGTLHGPVRTGSTFVENLLLEYTDGKPDVGWGCVDGAKLRALMQINTASWEYGTRTRAFARVYASGLIEHIEESMEQSATGKPVEGALGKPGDRLLILVGHDTNIATVAGALGLDWIIDGRVNDTPPGGALLFELWKPRSGGQPFVRLEYTAQTLEQMRAAQPLSQSNPPAVAPIFLPGCNSLPAGSSADLSCTWQGFSGVVQNAIQPNSAN
jgi:4-phytase / acid phosphatase